MFQLNPFVRIVARDAGDGRRHGEQMHRSARFLQHRRMIDGLIRGRRRAEGERFPFLSLLEQLVALLLEHRALAHLDPAEDPESFPPANQDQNQDGGEAVGVHDCERAGKRVMELVDLAGKLSGAGLATVLILILIGGWKGLWVFGWVQMRERAMLEQQRDQLFKEREEWKTLALRATATADKAVDHAAVLQKAG